MSEFTKTASGGMPEKHNTLLQLREKAKSERSEITADQIVKAYECSEQPPGGKVRFFRAIEKQLRYQPFQLGMKNAWQKPCIYSRS
jgi:hypothetical protein